MPAPSKRPASARRRAGPTRARLPPTRHTDGQGAALDIAWGALNIARDVKGLAMARNGAVLKVNAQLARLLGCSTASLEGKSVFGDLIERPHRQSLRKSMTRWTTTMVAGTGTRIPVEVRRERLKIAMETIEVYAIRDLRQRREDALKLRRQSTALQQRDEELHAQAQRFEMAVTSLSQGVCVFDADQRLVICNEPYLRMYGLSRDQAKPGTTVREILQQRIAQGLYSGARRGLHPRAADYGRITSAGCPHAHVFRRTHHPAWPPSDCRWRMGCHARRLHRAPDAQ